MLTGVQSTAQERTRHKHVHTHLETQPVYVKWNPDQVLDLLWAAYFSVNVHILV